MLFVACLGQYIRAAILHSERSKAVCGLTHKGTPSSCESFVLPHIADYVVFTYNDHQSGQNSGPYPPGASFIRGIIEQQWKIAMYYSPDGTQNATRTVQWVSGELAV